MIFISGIILKPSLKTKKGATSMEAGFETDFTTSKIQILEKELERAGEKLAEAEEKLVEMTRMLEEANARLLQQAIVNAKDYADLIAANVNTEIINNGAWDPPEKVF